MNKPIMYHHLIIALAVLLMGWVVGYMLALTYDKTCGDQERLSEITHGTNNVTMGTKK